MNSTKDCVGSVDNGADGRTWIGTAIADNRQVPRPFFNLVNVLPQTCEPTVLSIGYDQIDMLIDILQRVKQAGAPTPTEIAERRSAS